MLRIQYAELKGSVETRRLQMVGQMLCHLPHQVDESQHLQSSEHNTPWVQYMCQKATRPYKEYPVPSAVFCAISLNRSSPALPSFSSGGVAKSSTKTAQKKYKRSTKITLYFGGVFAKNYFPV